MPDTHTLEQILSGKGIAAITIIDDAFDPAKVSHIPTEDLNEFWNEFEENEALQDSLKKAGISMAKLGDLTDGLLQSMISGIDTIEGLRPHIDKLIASHTSKVRDAEDIVLNVESLKLTVYRIGTSGTFDHEQRCKIVLLDYYLGSSSGPDAEAAVETAVNRATEIYDRYKGQQEKPVFVLMSSQTLSDQQVLQFRKRSRLLGGMFHHAPKSLLKAKESLERKLLAIALSMPVVDVVAKLLESLDRSLSSAQDSFVNSLRDLSLEDYAYIDRLSLKEDGQPFGEYLLWLFSAGLQRSVFENSDVRGHQAAVDRVRFTEFPVRQLAPSLLLANMYGTAISEKLSGELEVHPLGDKENEYPLLSLGDIFVSPQQDLLMVINAACELAFSPVSEGRKFSKNKSIVLVPGKLEELAKASDFDDGKARTELFVHEEREFRIIWDVKRVVVKEYGEIKRWAEEKSYKRLYRLRPLYALQVQQKFTADFSRIGPPVAPPLFTPVRVDIFTFEKMGKYLKVAGPIDGHAALETGKQGLTCVFDLQLLEDLIGLIPKVQELLVERIQVLGEWLEKSRPTEAAAGADTAPTATESGPRSSDNEKAAKLQAKIARMKGFQETLRSFEADRMQQVSFIARAHPMPASGEAAEIDVPRGLFSLSYERLPTGNHQGESLFTLSIMKAT